MHTLRNVFLFVYEFAGDIHVGSKPMGIKKPKFVFGQIAVCPVGVEKQFNQLLQHCKYGKSFWNGKRKRLFLWKKKEVMQDQYKLTQLENRINKVCTDFNLLKESVSWLPIIIMICFYRV